MTIRAECGGDEDAIRRVNELAFGGAVEAGIVDELRRSCSGALSLVAVDSADIVGHILFTPVVLETPRGPVPGMGLGPMAVAPARQSQGIGSALVRAGLAALRERSCPFVIVLGHPGYYPRFGFVKASACGIHPPWQGVPDEAFMALILDPGAAANLTGTARYRPEFDKAL